MCAPAHPPIVREFLYAVFQSPSQSCTLFCHPQIVLPVYECPKGGSYEEHEAEARQRFRELQAQQVIKAANFHFDSAAPVLDHLLPHCFEYAACYKAFRRKTPAI